jgi:Flp pilus assembly protein TadG
MRKQRGVTMIGWIFLLIPMALVIFAAIRVGPIYYEYYKMLSAVQATASEMTSDETKSPKTIRTAIQRRFDSSYVDDTKAEDLEVTKAENGWQVGIVYDEEAPLFGNMLLLLRFDKQVEFN